MFLEALEALLRRAGSSNRKGNGKAAEAFMQAQSESERPKVALFVTCLVNVMRPGIAEATRDLLVAAGCDVEVPLDQTCCGQPAFNSGDEASGRAMARHQIEVLESYPYVVAPSGSCAGTIRHDYPTRSRRSRLAAPRRRPGGPHP